MRSSGKIAIVASGAAALVAWAVYRRRRRRQLPLEQLGERNSRMHSAESVARGRSFAPRASDVFVVTYPKCGTTWMTQICHQLRTGGDEAFGEITEVVPWDVLALDCGQDLDADQRAFPRVFKSHESAGEVAPGAKYIYVARDPEDAFVSFYHFLPAYMQLDGDLTMEQFAEAVFGGLSHSGGIWDHFVGWWARRADREHVLWVCFEDLKDDLPGETARVAKFLGGGCGAAARVSAAVERSTYAYMSARQSQFDDHFVFDNVKEQMGFAPDVRCGASKVRKGGGKVGGRSEIPPRVRQMLRDRWRTTVEAKTGLKSYDALREAVRELRE